MSSATRVDMNATRNLIGGLQIVNEGDGPTDHLSLRQRELDRLWRYYRCTNYDGRKYDWDGRENLDHLEHEAFAMQGTTPPGYYDAGGATTPLKFRKPTAPYYLGRVIPDRFTGMLFGRKRRPRVTVDDPKTEDWLIGFAQATRFWAQWIKARTFGGGMGTVCVGFAFRKGKPSVEVHDPRWCFPEFSDRSTHELRKLEKRYQYPDEVKNGDGEWETKWFWYRRVIDAQTDTVWPRVPVEGNQEPVWTQYPHNTATHGLGEVPAVWIQNQPVDDDIDGDPDCHGIYPQIEEIDALWSQAGRGTKANCDPTLEINSNLEFEEGLRKGSENAIQVEIGGKVGYLEMNGAGIETAMGLAEKLEEKALTVARCVLDRNEGGVARSPDEVDHNYSAMIDQADILREQYGELGIQRLLEKVLRAAHKMMVGSIDRGLRVVGEPEPNPKLVRQKIQLPKRKQIVDEENGTFEYVERELGDGEQVELVWPDYFTPSSTEIAAVVDAAGKAKTMYGLLDLEHAVGAVASYFHVENVAALVKRLKDDQAAQQQAQQAMMGGYPPPGTF